MRIKGIDIYDGDGFVDFEQVKACGYDFVIIKCGGNEGGGRWITKNFYRSYVKAKAAGLSVGAYFYAGESRGSGAGKSDAVFADAILRGCRLDFPVFYDFEEGNAREADANTAACAAFCEEMESRGYYVGIYASDVWGFDELLNKDRLTSYDWWIARYGREPKNSWCIWQYTSTEIVPGVDHKCDVNECRIDYPSIIIEKGFNGYQGRYTGK